MTESALVDFHELRQGFIPPNHVRKIAPHAGGKSALRLFDELVKCDEKGILKEVREVIEGK